MAPFSGWISESVDFLNGLGILKQVASSLLLFLAFFIFRSSTIVMIRRWHAPTPDEKRRWIIQFKNLSLIILAAGLFGIWATELRTFALSLVAVAAALVVSTKEIILCFMGGFYKASARPFELGDRIEVAGFRGEVIDHNFLSTTLLEIGPYRENQALSGRQIVLPNSLLLGGAILNQSLQQQYVMQAVRFVVEKNEDWEKLEKILLNSAEKECSSFLESARRTIERHGQREGLDLPKADPRVTFQYSDDGVLHATLRFPTPLNRVSLTEQAILRSVIRERRLNAPPHPL